ncbi:suppressor of kinetochore protein mutant [Balamuthia mandrillaris]
MERSGGGGGGKALRLESADGEIFDVPEEVAMCSRTVKHMLTDLEDVGPESMPHCEDEEDETAPIFLPNVPSSILSLVIEYCGWLVTSEFYQTNKRKTKKKTEHESKQKEKRIG